MFTGVDVQYVKVLLKVLNCS